MIQSLEFNYNVTFNYDLASSLCVHTIDSLTKKRHVMNVNILFTF